jgi:hypothetical protein
MFTVPQKSETLIINHLVKVPNTPPRGGGGVPYRTPATGSVKLKTEPSPNWLVTLNTPL